MTTEVDSVPKTPIRGRPRSASISSGSPLTLPALRMPQLSTTNLLSDARSLGNDGQQTTNETSNDINNPNSPQCRSPLSQNNTLNLSLQTGNSFGSSPLSIGGLSEGWGHRTSLSIGSAPGTRARLGKHRRTQSVSPPGFNLPHLTALAELAESIPPSIDLNPNESHPSETLSVASSSSQELASPPPSDQLMSPPFGPTEGSPSLPELELDSLVNGFSIDPDDKAGLWDGSECTPFDSCEIEQQPPSTREVSPRSEYLTSPPPSSRARSSSFGTQSPASRYLENNPSRPTLKRTVVSESGRTSSPPLSSFHPYSAAPSSPPLSTSPLDHALRRVPSNGSLPGSPPFQHTIPKFHLSPTASSSISTNDFQESQHDRVVVDEGDPENAPQSGSLFPDRTTPLIVRRGNEGLELDIPIPGRLSPSPSPQSPPTSSNLQPEATISDLNLTSLFGSSTANGEFESLGQSNIDIGHDELAGGHGLMVGCEDNKFSVLERIMWCVRNEDARLRARVAAKLPIWLKFVDISEAVEYVLPALANFPSEREELIRDLFAHNLDAIMWHFFDNCPLIECDDEVEEPIALSPLLSSYEEPTTNLVEKSSPTSTGFASDPGSPQSYPSSHTGESPPPRFVDPPKISVSSFTKILGSFLTEASPTVALTAQYALIRFLCRLRQKPLPPFETLNDHLDTEFLEQLNMDEDDDPTLESFSRYSLTKEAIRMLEYEVITGIILGLARLDEFETNTDNESVIDSTIHQSPLVCDSTLEITLPSTLASDPSTPELTSIPLENDEDAGMSKSLELPAVEDPIATWSSCGDSLNPMWGQPLVSYSTANRTLSSPPAQVHSAFSPDNQENEDITVGKVASMNLIGIIASIDCLEPETIRDQLFPEVERMKEDLTYFVRKEAVDALAKLAGCLPKPSLTESVLPLYTIFSNDHMYHVRRAAVLALPHILARFPPSIQKSQAVESLAAFSGDLNRQVRSGALEIIGELIYLFHSHPDGVPEELIVFFLGKTVSQPIEPTFGGLDDDEDSFAPLSTALDSPKETAPCDEIWGVSNAAQDLFRSGCCAFNFPAVALTLGKEKWDTLRDYYRKLCLEQSEQSRQTLAASLHEIAKILGAELATKDLLEPFYSFLTDTNSESTQSMVLENLDVFVIALGPEGGKMALQKVYYAWGELKSWRLRQTLVTKLAPLVNACMTNDGIEDLFGLLSLGFKDSIAAVRDRAVAIMPEIFDSLENSKSMIARQKVLAFLSVFAEDSSFRNRVTFLSSVMECIKNGMKKESFEDCFLVHLSRMATDRVLNVRINVSLLIAEACKTDGLYKEKSSRDAIVDIFVSLSQSPERDVVEPITQFYEPTPPPPIHLPESNPNSYFDSSPTSPCFSPHSSSRPGATSRMGMNDDEGMFDASFDRSIEDEMDLDEIPLDEDSETGSFIFPHTTRTNTAGRSPPLSLSFSQSLMGEGEGDQLDQLDGDGDVSMMDDVILLDSPFSPTNVLSPRSGLTSFPWIRELVTSEIENEDEFIEVSRQ